MRRLLLPLLLAFSTPALWALPQELAVTVIDQDLGTPLQGVRLTVRGVEGTYQTDAAGKVTISRASGGAPQLLIARLPGYETKKVVVLAGTHALEIKMVLAGMIQGNELVVEKPRPQITEAQPGVSQAVTKDQITTTTMGVFQDVMSTIKTLPGVGYTSPFNAEPSIQGGNPDELMATLDGADVLYPYQWGGTFSVFNPDMVESALLSDGIVSAQYGNFLSGLLEVTTITPTQVQPTFAIDLSTSEVDLFASAPLWKNAGLYVGGTQTWLQLPLALFGESRFAPSLTDGFAKLYWNPSDRVRWLLDGMIDTDGIAINNSSRGSPTPPNTLATSGTATYGNSQVLVASTLKLLLSDDLLLNLLLNFNNHDLNFEAQSVVNGTQYYDQGFIDTHTSILHGATSFTLNKLTSSLSQSTNDYLYQGKADFDWQLAHDDLLSFGVETVLQNATMSQNLDTWQTVSSGSTPQFVNVVSNITTNGNNTLTSALFADYTFSLWNGLLKGDAGVRGNYTVVYNSAMTLQTLPDVDPRIRLTLTPIRNRGPFESVSFVAGTGLFSQFLANDPFIDTSYGLRNFQVGPERAWFNELGLEAKTKDGWTLNLDGYYKSYFDRFYVVGNQLATPESYSVYDDGTGFATGVDALLERSTRYWQGWISYSFVVTRLYNPAQPGSTDTAGEPTGIWYYPSYNIMNTISLVLTLTPTSGFSFTTEAQIASGAPLPQLGSISSYATALPDGMVVERFSRSSTYSDTLRSGWSFPVDLKAAWHGYFKGSKLSWQFYVAVQDLLAPLYAAAAAGPAPFDPWTGDTLTGTAAAAYSLGFPIPSVGYELTF